MLFPHHKVLGMLWGLHAGDSLGAPWEFLPPSARWNEHTEIVGGGKFQWKPGEATDDTDLMLCVLRSLRGPCEISFDQLKDEMLAWMASNPPDIGNTTIKGLRNLQAGLPLLECGFVDDKFQGNGSIMRVAPLSLLQEDSVGTYQGKNISSLMTIMEHQTKMTHGHIFCVESDRVFIAALKEALRGCGKNEIFERALCEARQQSPLIAERVAQIPSLSWDQLATSGFCVDTLCAGLWGFLKYDNFEESIVAVINRGDDSDSCGAVAGALCGAFYGAEAIPERWLQSLEFRDEIAQVLRTKQITL